MKDAQMQNACFKCRYRGNVPGSAHSSCGHPKVKETLDGDPMAGMLGMLLKAANQHAAKALNIRAEPHGIQNGWFAWPLNFDPVWLRWCDGFKPVEGRCPDGKVCETNGTCIAEDRCSRVVQGDPPKRGAFHSKDWPRWVIAHTDPTSIEGREAKCSLMNPTELIFKLLHEVTGRGLVFAKADPDKAETWMSEAHAIVVCVIDGSVDLSHCVRRLAELTYEGLWASEIKTDTPKAEA